MSRFGDTPRTFDAIGKFPEPRLYVCPPRVKKGVIVRGDVELDAPIIATLPVGTQMTVYRSKHTADGKVRLKIKTPVVGWVSEKAVEQYAPPLDDSDDERLDENGRPLNEKRKARGDANEPEKFNVKNPLAGQVSVTPEDYMQKLKWTQSQDPGEVEIVIKMNPGTKKEEIDVLFNYRRLRVFVGEQCILDDVLYNPVICEGCTWTYNERSRKLEVSLTKDSDTIVWCACFLAKDADGNCPIDEMEEQMERDRMEKFLPKRS